MARTSCPLLLLLMAAVLISACVSKPRDPAPWDHTVRALTDDRILTPPQLTFAKRTELEAKLRAAKAALDAAPESEDALIWFGRRLAYLYRYGDAIDTFSRGIELHPQSYRLLRHRGHRYITVRRFELAERDLARAAKLAEGTQDQVEPDGAPNAAGVPLSTDHSNIWYHLALAQYLRGDFVQAERSWARCVEIRRSNDDSLVSSSYWHYLTLRRLGRDADGARVLATIRADMTIVENKSYHAALLMFKGERARESLRRAVHSGDLDASTIGYVLGMAALLEGDAAAARAEFQGVIDNTQWIMFGHIAAEAELARMSDR
jgi:tetratricopeptide (TPR) repeat protein